MSHSHARQLLGFYRSCYLADSRDLDLDNLGIPLLPLSAELGRALAEAQAQYQRELQLV